MSVIRAALCQLYKTKMPWANLRICCLWIEQFELLGSPTHRLRLRNWAKFRTFLSRTCVASCVQRHYADSAEQNASVWQRLWPALHRRHGILECSGGHLQISQRTLIRAGETMIQHKWDFCLLRELRNDAKAAKTVDITPSDGLGPYISPGKNILFRIRSAGLLLRSGQKPTHLHADSY